MRPLFYSVRIFAPRKSGETSSRARAYLVRNAGAMPPTSLFTDTENSYVACYRPVLRRARAAETTTIHNMLSTDNRLNEIRPVLEGAQLPRTNIYQHSSVFRASVLGPGWPPRQSTKVNGTLTKHNRRDAARARARTGPRMMHIR